MRGPWLLALLSLLTACSRAPTEGAVLVKVERGALVDRASASGTIEPVVQVDVKSRASGEVVEVLAREGERVEAGAPLARIDPRASELALKNAESVERRLRAQLQEAEATAALSKAELAKVSEDVRVSEKGRELGLVASEAGRTTTHARAIAEGTAKLREAQVEGVRAQLEGARLDVAERRRQLDETIVKAPFAGTVLTVDVERGSMVASALTNVSGGSRLLVLADLSELRVIGQLDEAQVGRVAPGLPVDIRVDAYPERTFAGTVARVSPLGELVSNVVTFDVEVVVTDQDAKLLRSGMSADLEVVVATLQDVLLVPLTAVRSEGGRRYVVARGGEKRFVKTGPTDGAKLVVLEGLDEGDELELAPKKKEAAAKGGAGLLPSPPRGMRPP